jgi:cell division septation protein DedD
MYYVQVGAFKDRKNADKYLVEVKKRYKDAFIKNYGGMFYVQVGAFSVQANAAAYLAEVREVYKDSFVKTF